MEEKEFSTEEVCHLLIVREVLNKKDLGPAESRLFQRGWIGLLFGWKAWQNTAREVCYYLKLLRGFFQWENKVVDDLWQKKRIGKRRYILWPILIKWTRGHVILTVRDCPKRNRLSTRVSLGILNTILTLSGSSTGGSGGRHSDFLSFSSSSV